MQSVIQVLRKLIIISGILLVLGYVGNLLIDNPYVHRLVRDLINKQLDEYTSLTVKFEAINVRFIPLGIDLYGIEIKQKTEEGPNSLLQASHIRLRLSVIATLLSKPELLNLEINEPKLALPVPPLDKLLKMEKFPELLENKDQPVFWPPKGQLPFYRIALQNLQLEVTIPDSNPKAPRLLYSRLEGFDLVFFFRSLADFDLDLHLRRGNLEVEGAHLLRDADIQANLRMSEESLNSSFLRVSSNELTAQSQLDISFETSKPVAKPGLFEDSRRVLKGLNIQMKHQVEQADLAILGRYLNTDKTQGPILGNLEGNINISLAEDKIDWQLKGSAQADKTILSGFKLFESKLDFLINDRGMEFQKAIVIKDKRELARGQGFLAFDKKTNFNFNIATKDLPFDLLMSILQVEDFSAISARLDSQNLTLSGQASPFQMRVEGLAEFKQLSLPFVKELPNRFVEAPNCLIDTTLLIDEERLKIEKGVSRCSSKDTTQFENSPIQIGGHFGFSEALGMSLSISSKDLAGELLQHFIKLPAKGILQPNIKIEGPYESLVISGDLKGENLEIGGFSFQTASTNFKFPLAEEKIYVSNFSSRSGRNGEIKVKDSTLTIHEPYNVSLQIEASQLPTDFIPKGLEKSFDIKNLDVVIQKLVGRIKGPLLRPFLYQGQLDFESLDLQIDEQRIYSQLNGSLTADQKHWNLRDIYVRLQDLKVKSEINLVRTASVSQLSDIWGKLGLSPKDQLAIKVTSLNQLPTQYRTNDLSEASNHLASLPFVGEFFKQHQFGSEIHLDADFQGSYRAMNGHFQASLEQPYIWDIPISSITVAGFISDGKLNIPEVRHSGNALVGRIFIDFTKDDLPYEWYFYMNQLDIRALIGKTFAEDPRNFAYVTADWTMAGKLKNFWGSTGDFTLSKIRSKIFQNLGNRTSSIEVNSDEPIRLKISPEIWQFADKRPLKLKGEYFDLELSSGRTQLPNKLDLVLQGSVKMDLLKSFSSIMETAKGEILLEGRLKGSLAKPEFSLKLKERKLDPFSDNQWVPLSFGLVDFGPAFSNISMDLEILNDRVMVNKFSANKGREGTLNASGTVGFSPETADQSRLNIQLSRIEFARLNIPVLKTADLVMSGELVMTGSAIPYHLEGNVQIDRFQSVGNFDLRREIVSALYDTKLISGGNKQNSAPDKPHFTLDIQVDADRSILIKNKSLDVIVSSNLKVRGNDVYPLLLGQVIADRGSFNYRRQFKLSKAVISFDEPVTPPNPRIDIAGETTVNPYQVQVTVTGDLSSPKVNLTCDPPNREDGSAINSLDIFLLLTTGKIPDQANKTAGRASVNELFSSFLVFAEEPIEKLFDISGQTVVREVYIDSYLSETEQRPITRLNVPFNLWGFANAVVQVDDESNSKVSFEYPIHEGITFSGSLVDRKANNLSNKQTNSAAETGFDLKFRFGFD